MAIIKLTKDRVAIVGGQDVSMLGKYRWFAYKNKHVWYAGTTMVGENGKRRTVQMHRLILGARPGQIIDHKDCDGLNNTRANLRLCTPEENNRHRRKPVSNTSGYKGVVWEHRSRKWVGRLGSNGKKIYLGVFDSKEQAAKIYDAALRKHHGEFALPNSPKDREVG